MENITKNFSGVTVLDNVNFELVKGEVCAICGENGAGKSTLIKILAGIYKKDSGNIFIKNKEININNPKVAEKNGISFVHQDLNLIPSFNIAQSIFLGNEPTHFFGLVDWKILYQEASKVLSYLNVRLDPKESIKNLSIGEKQIVAIARAILSNAKIIVFDEPTSSLDKDSVKILFSVIKNLKNKNTSIIYISHYLDEVFEVSDRIMVLRNGKNVGTMLANKTKINELISKILGRKLGEQFPNKKETLMKDVIFKVRNITIEGIIEDINFDLREGEILGFFGLIGCGSSELADAIFGIRSYDKGSIYLKEKKLCINSPEEANKAGISLIPADKAKQGFFPNMSVKENLTIANLDRCCRKLKIIDLKKEEKDTITLVNQLNVQASNINKNVIFLSGGNQQKIVLGKWLYRDSKIYIFNEPTKGIDIGAKKEIYKLTLDLAKRGAAIIFITQETSEILKLCDRVIFRNFKIM